LLSSDAPDVAGAETEFKTALRLKPGYADAECNLGNLYWQQREPAKAEALFRQAIASDPRFLKGYLSLANMLAGENRFAEATSVLQKAEVIAPANAVVQNMLGQIKAQGGKVPRFSSK
jgi:protein O-GlcNAc transferase